MNRKKEIFIFIFVFLFLSLAGIIVFDIRSEVEESTDYSTYNSGKNGVKVLYQLAKEMGFKVGRHGKSARFLPDGVTLVAFAPSKHIINGNLEQKYLLEWIERGNIFIFIDSKEADLGEKYKILNRQTDYTKVFSYFGDNRVYNIGKGKVIYLDDFKRYTNGRIKDLDPGVVFVHALQVSSNKRVLFNEFYHGLGKEITPLDIVGFSGKIILTQLLLAFIIYIYIKSKRFGKPLVVYQTIKREENENMFALSNIYVKAKANSMVLEIIYEKFKKEIANFLGYKGKEINYHEVFNEAQKSPLFKDMNIKQLVKDCEEYIKNNYNDKKTIEKLSIKLEEVRRVIKG